MTSHRKIQIIVIASTLCFFSIDARSQNNLKSPDEPRCVDTDNDTVAASTSPHATLCFIEPTRVRKLGPNVLLRWLRASQTQYQLSEQPAFVVVNLNGQSQIVPNPQKYLSQYTFPFVGSELVPNTSNLASIVAAIYNADPTNATITNSDPSSSDPSGKKTLVLGDKLCRNSTLIECLVSGSNFWERLIAGVSGNASLAQRDEVQQGIILPGLPTSISYGPGGEIDFDPSSLFITGANWQSVLATLKGIKLDPSSFSDKEGKEEYDCFVTGTTMKPGECVNKFAAPRLDARKKSRTLALVGAELIPKFQFKVTDQFDFIKNGGVLVAEPGL
jgi:hypothetical protein